MVPRYYNELNISCGFTVVRIQSQHNCYLCVKLCFNFGFWFHDTLHEFLVCVLHIEKHLFESLVQKLFEYMRYFRCIYYCMCTLLVYMVYKSLPNNQNTTSSCSVWMLCNHLVLASQENMMNKKKNENERPTCEWILFGLCCFSQLNSVHKNKNRMHGISLSIEKFEKAAMRILFYIQYMYIQCA